MCRWPGRFEWGYLPLDCCWVFLNATYRQTTFAAGAYGVGAVFCLLAFLPPDNWMYRHITTRLPMRDNLRPWPRRRKR
jgi:hypothetical protein